MNTMENNKLIAEFMGYPKIANDEDKRDYLEDCVKYHESWDWLMPVAEKIKDGAYNGIILEKVDEIDFRLTCDLRKENIYKAVVEFINQYNK